MNSLFALALACLAAMVGAQQTYTINPKNVPLWLRDTWCQNQQTQCPLICLQTSAHSAETRQNTCNSTLLTYACVCSNGLSPNLTQYSQTLPFYICQEWGNECVHNCHDDAACASSCREDHPCGAQDPAPPNKTAMTTKMSTTGLPQGTKSGTVYSGFAGQGTGKASGGAAGRVSVPLFMPAVMQYGNGMGMLLVLGGFFLGFAVML